MNENKVTILYGGAGRELVIGRLLDQGFAISALCLPAVFPERREESLARSRAMAAARGVPVEKVSSETVGEVLRRHQGGVLLNLGGEWYLPESVRGMFDLCLNVHPTLLPKYRGNSSIANVILNGDEFHGSTVHVMDDGIDTGPILMQSSFPVTRTDTYRSIREKAYALEPGLVCEALAAVFADRAEFIEQNEAEATEAPRTPEDSRLNPSLSLLDLYDSIRACDPDAFPAFFEMDGRRIEIRLKMEEEAE